MATAKFLRCSVFGISFALLTPDIHSRLWRRSKPWQSRSEYELATRRQRRRHQRANKVETDRRAHNYDKFRSRLNPKQSDVI